MGSLFAVLGVYLFVILAIAVVTIIADWKIFEKAGEEGWKSIIPFYNQYIMFKITWDVKYFWITLVFTIVAQIIGTFSESNALLIASQCVIMVALFIINVIQLNYLSKAFSKNSGFTVGLVLLSFVFVPMLGFGKSEYIGNVYDTFKEE